MHRLILGLDDNPMFVCDHIYSDRKYDNRKQNLRITEQKYNAKNRMRASNNTSGKTGVSWSKRKNKWVAYIGVNNKHVYLGSYNNIQEAIDVRLKAEEKYFGEYKVINEH